MTYFNFDAFAADVRGYFEEACFSFAEVARELQLNERTVALATKQSRTRQEIDWRRGRMPSLRVVCVLASFCGLSLDAYVGDVLCGPSN